MPTLTEIKIEKLSAFRGGLLELKKADLTPKLISSYWEANRDKLTPSGITDSIGRYIQTLVGIDDVDALDGARDDIVGMLNATIASLTNADVRPILDDLSEGQRRKTFNASGRVQRDQKWATELSGDSSSDDHLFNNSGKSQAGSAGRSVSN